MNRLTTEDYRANEALHAMRLAVREVLLERKRKGCSAIFADKDGKLIQVEADDLAIEEEPLEYSSISAKDVAEYLIAKTGSSNELSNMKLQKLVYYAQAAHLAIFSKPLFSEEIEAWMHGPVIPSLYHEYKKFGSRKITQDKRKDFSLFSQEQINLLDYIRKQYGKHLAWKLGNMTHKDAPWKDAVASTSIIGKSKMMDFYKKEFDYADIRRQVMLS